MLRLATESLTAVTSLRACRSSADGVQGEIILQEEEVQIFPVPEVAQNTVCADPFNHSIEVRVQAPLTFMEENLLHNQAPRVVEVQDEDPKNVEEEDFNIDLVDQLARVSREFRSVI